MMHATIGVKCVYNAQVADRTAFCTDIMMMVISIFPRVNILLIFLCAKLLNHAIFPTSTRERWCIAAARSLLCCKSQRFHLLQIFSLDVSTANVHNNGTNNSTSFIITVTFHVALCGSVACKNYGRSVLLLTGWIIKALSLINKSAESYLRTDRVAPMLHSPYTLHSGPTKKLPFPVGVWTDVQYIVPWPSHHPRRHLDRVSHFFTVHARYQRTDRTTTELVW